MKKPLLIALLIGLVVASMVGVASAASSHWKENGDYYVDRYSEYTWGNYNVCYVVRDKWHGGTSISCVAD